MPGPNLPTLIRAALVWLLFALAESAQGALRRVLFSAEVELAVRQVSVVMGAGVLFAITWFTFRWMRLRTPAAALAVGGLWVALTLVFEVALGWATGATWDAMALDYDIRRGGLMPFGLLAVALTPWAALRLRGTARG